MTMVIILMVAHVKPNWNQIVTELIRWNSVNIDGGILIPPLNYKTKRKLGRIGVPSISNWG